MANLTSRVLPRDLNHSELGTKEYWDNYYQTNLDSGEALDEPIEPSELESWFDEVDAPTKVLDYLTSEEFPYSPNNESRTTASPSVLDVGTGNGSALFQLRIDGNYTGRMVGMDYSQQSIDLATRLWQGYIKNQDALDDGQSLRQEDITFAKADLIHNDLSQEGWWPDGGFDLVHDKGTFDAISLSSEQVIAADGTQRPIFEVYPERVARLVKPGGYLIITSVNWTENELRRWFLESDGARGELEEFGKVKYPSYEFGGRKGQSAATLCFRRVQG